MRACVGWPSGNQSGGNPFFNKLISGAINLVVGPFHEVGLVILRLLDKVSRQTDDSGPIS